MKTYHEGEPFPGKIGRTWDVSEPAFPVERRAPAGAPNLLYIVLDDVGFGAADTFGGLIETPNITRLAKGGLSYTNFHTTALCSPTRACLLTGRNHHSVGMANITELATGFPGYNGRQPMNKAGIAAMLHTHGYNSFALGKWHNTASEETGPTGPFDRWPDGPLFGFDRFYGFFGGDSNQWYPKLYAGREPIDQPKLPSEGYHLSEDLIDKTKELIANHESVDPDKPWLGFLAFGACHAPHHVWKSWIDKYKGRFDGGWDKYREETLARQKKLGILPQQAVLSPMLDGVPAWDTLSPDQKKLYARMMETYAGFLSHTDAQIGRLIEFLETTGDLDNTLICVFIGDNGASGEGTLTGLFNELSLVTTDAAAIETVDRNLKRIDQLGQPGSYNHYPVGWALAMNAPFKLCKQYTHFGGTRNPLVVHWPKGIKARGELRTQFHHVIDIVPTLLAAAGVSAPAEINSVAQAPIEGVPMNYSFADAKAPTTHTTQYFEMLGNRAIIDGKWKAVTYHGRKPWENLAPITFDEDHWELYDLENDPAESHDLMQGKEHADRSDPHVQRVTDLIGLWWAEAGRYNVLPLDDRFMERTLSRAGLDTRQKFRFYPRTVRVPEHVAPSTLNRSWSIAATIEVPDARANGPLVVMGGDTSGWSLYLKNGVVNFCYNYAAAEYTYIRASAPLTPGKHVVRYEFELRPSDKDDSGRPVSFGAGGIGRIFIDQRKVAEGTIPRTMAFGYCLDETFDIGCDKGAPVTDEYAPLAAFTGRIEHVDIDISPDFAFDQDKQQAAHLSQAMARQ